MELETLKRENGKLDQDNKELLEEAKQIRQKVLRAKEELKRAQARVKRADKRKHWCDRIARKLLLEIQQMSTTYPCIEMPNVPSEVIQLKQKPTLPQEPGIYFIWDSFHVVYVGQSVCLANRVRIGHPNIKNGDKASFLLWPEDDLSLTECYYIWRCKPERNREGKIGGQLSTGFKH